MKQAQTRTIGENNGVGDMFIASVEYTDGSVGRIVVYGHSLQMTSRLLNAFRSVWGFKVTDLF